MRTEPMRLAAVVGAVMTLASALALLVLTSAPAQASFPAPNNGKIVFSKYFDRDDVGTSSDIYSVNPDGTGLKQLTSDEGQDIYDGNLVYSPDGQKIVWVTSTYTYDEGTAPENYDRVWVMNADGSAKRLLDSGLVYDESDVAFSPDGDEVAYGCSPRAYGNQKDICTARIDGSGFRNLTKTRDKVEHHFTWSPDGEWLAFVSEQCRRVDCPEEGGYYRVSSATFKIRADGSSLTRLTPDRLEGDTIAPDSDLAWSPDGKRIAFVRYIDPPPLGGRDGGRTILTMRPDGTGLARLTKASGSETGPAWSPDSMHLVYSFYLYRDGSSDSGLLRMRAAGTHKVRLTQTHDYGSHYLWAPNGERIAFERSSYDVVEERGTYYLYTMKPDGSDKRLVITAPYGFGAYDWQPRP